MDKQKALHILCLGQSPSIEEVKSAYRIMARQFHPDRFSHDASLKEKSESRMKEINLAFHTLSQLTKSDNYVKKSCINFRKFYECHIKEGRVAIFLTVLYKIFNKIIFRHPVKHHTRHETEDPPRHQGEYQYHTGYLSIHYKTGLKRSSSGAKNKCSPCNNHGTSKDSRNKKQNFDAILSKSMKQEFHGGTNKNSVMKRGTFSSSVRNNPSGVRIQFRTYLAERQNMKRKKRFMDTDSGPVERISPVSPII